MKNTLTTIILLVSFFTINAQSKFHVFIGPGLGQVQGDLTETGLPHPKSLKFNGKLGVGYDFNNRYGLRLHASGGRMHGSDFYTLDPGKHKRGGTFNTLLIDAGLTFKIQNIIKSTKYMNYAYFGADYMYMAPTISYSGTQEIPAERAFSQHQVNLPIGLGLGYWFTDYFGLAWENTLHITFTDYLDGISLAGNPRRNDKYFDSHILAVFKFGKPKGGKFSGRKKRKFDSMGSLDCPKF